MRQEISVYKAIINLIKHPTNLLMDLSFLHDDINRVITRIVQVSQPHTSHFKAIVKSCKWQFFHCQSEFFVCTVEAPSVSLVKITGNFLTPSNTYKRLYQNVRSDSCYLLLISCGGNKTIDFFDRAPLNFEMWTVDTQQYENIAVRIGITISWFQVSTLYIPINSILRATLFI